MSYYGQIYVQPSELAFQGGLQPGWNRGIPSPGCPRLGVPAITGATCQSLLSANPPSLLEHYEIFGLVIGFAAVMITASTSDVVSVEATLLLNGSAVYTNIISESASIISAYSGASDAALLAGAWSADLVNPITVGSSDSLSLRVGVESAVATTFGPAGTDSAPRIFVGTQATYHTDSVAANEGPRVAPYESFINFRGGTA